MNIACSFLYARKVFFSHGTSGGGASIGHRSLLGAVICIAVSLVPLVALTSVSSGMISGMTGRMIHLSTHDIQVAVPSDCESLSSSGSFIELSKKFSGVDGVINVHPEVQGMALATGKSYRTGATFRGVRKDVFDVDPYFAALFSIVEGSPDLSKKRSAVIGQKLSEILDVHPGDALRLITMNSDGTKFVPKVSSFTVTGVVSCGYQELDALWVFIPLEDAFGAVAASSSRFVIGLETEDSFSKKLFEICSAVRIKLLSDPLLAASEVETWQQANASQFENFASTKALLIVIMFAIILVACINISSSIVMIVMERRKEIAILKSSGASSGEITMAFVFVGLLAGGFGILAGVPSGIIVSVFINSIIAGLEKIMNASVGFVYMIFNGGENFSGLKILDPAFYLQEIPVNIPSAEVFLIVVLTILLSLVMSIVPSIKAGRSKIIEVLKKS